MREVTLTVDEAKKIITNNANEEMDFIYHMYKVVFEKKPAVIIDAKEHINYRWIEPAEALTLDLIEDEDVCINMWYPLH